MPKHLDPDINPLQYVPPPPIDIDNMPVEVNVVSLLNQRSVPASGPATGPGVHEVNIETCTLAEYGLSARDVGASKFANPAIADECAEPTGMNRLTYGKKDATLVFYLVTGFLLIVLFALFGLCVSRSRKKGKKRQSYEEAGVVWASQGG